MKTTGYAAYGFQDRTPAQVAAIYDKRSRIEKSYVKFRKARAVTTTSSTTIRLFYVYRLSVRAVVAGVAVGDARPAAA